MEYHELILPSDVKENTNPKDVTVFHLNVRSLQNKEDDVCTLLDDCDVAFDVIMFSETWYQDDQPVLNLPGYKHFCLNRICRRGGGVAIYAEQRETYQILDCLTEMNEDYEILTLTSGSRLFSVVYRPPSANVAGFLSFLDSYLEFAPTNYFSFVLGGDFNINMMEPSHAGTQFRSVLSSFRYENAILTSTRTTLESESVLDLFITNIS